MSQFDTVIERKGTYSVKYNEKVIKSFANNEKALPFWVADMDFATPQVILDAIKKELDSSILGYPYIQDVAQSFISFAQKKHDISFDPSLVVVAPGMLSSIAILIELYSNKGDSIILPFPSYHPFVDIINTLERKVLPWPLNYNDETHTFTLDFPLLKELTKDNNSPILLFCSPHNPTGIVFSKEELEEIAKIVKESSMMVISDEIHADLAFNGEKHIPFHQIASEYNIPCITCMAPSKTFNIAGEHFSIAICSDKKIYINLVKRLKSLHVAPDVLATVASKAAYEKGYEWLISLIDYLEENIKVIEETLKEYNSQISIVKPEASFIAFLDCKNIYPSVVKDSLTHPHLYESQGDGGLLSRFFGQKGGIAMNDGSWFGPAYTEFVRFNYASPKSAVKEAIKAICEAEKKLLEEYPL